MIGERIDLETTDSTNTVAASYIRSGLERAVLVVADEQTSGRGRLGRAWTSPKGNLYCSVLLPPSGGVPDPRLSFVTANAVYETAAGLVADRGALAIKWPNDILAGGKKLSGILIEAVSHEGEVFSILGVGINIVAETTERVPADIAQNVTALHLLGAGPVTRDDVLDAFLKHLESWCDRYRDEGFAPVREFWNGHCNSIGKKVEIPSKKQEGIAQGIDEKGQLLVQTPAGQLALGSDEIRFLAD